MSEPLEWRDKQDRTWWQPRSKSGKTLHLNRLSGRVSWTDKPYAFHIPKRYRSKRRAEHIARRHGMYEKAAQFTLVRQPTYDDCVFCAIVAGQAPAKYRAKGNLSIAIEPLEPVTPGHFLVIPHTHVTDAIEDLDVTAQTMHDAAMWTRLSRRTDRRYKSVDFITSFGQNANQSVPHLHIHVIPRPTTKTK